MSALTAVWPGTLTGTQFRRQLLADGAAPRARGFRAAGVCYLKREGRLRRLEAERLDVALLLSGDAARGSTNIDLN